MPSLSFESKLLLWVGLVFGSIAAMFVPPVSTVDAPSHFGRTLGIALGSFRAQQLSKDGFGSQLPVGNCLWVETLWTSYWANKDLQNFEKWSALSKVAAQNQSPFPYEYTNTAIYSPINYLFSAFGMRIARFFSDGPLLSDRLGCFSNLFGYLFLMVVVIEKIPHLRRGILLIATTPVILNQAATLSADGINFCLPLVLLACVSVLREKSQGTPRDLLPVLLLGIVVVLLKPTAIVFLLVLVLIPPEYFTTTKGRYLGLLAYGSTALMVCILWNRPYLSVDIARWFSPSLPPAAVQMEWIKSHPYDFVAATLASITKQIAGDWTNFYTTVVAGVSESVKQSQTSISYLFTGAWLCCTNPPEKKRDLEWTFGILILAAFLFALTCAVLWRTFATPQSLEIPMLSARYLVIIYTLLWFVWAQLRPRLPESVRNTSFLIGLCANLSSLYIVLWPAVERSLFPR